MKNLIKIAFVAALVGFTSCETGELELLTSPNSVTTNSADPNFILNDIQLSFNGAIVGGFNAASRGITRMTNQFGNYNGAITNTTANGEWSNTYQLKANVNLLQTLNDDAEDSQKIPYHLGMAKILEAYSFFLLVDYLGDVPFSEAVNPGEFPNPSLDPGRSVYDAQLERLDEAIADINSASGIVRVPNDLFYGGGTGFNAANWIALANTLKLRAYLNLRLVDPATAAQGINSVASGNIIDTADEDFEFSYSTSEDPVESRHPFFTGNYLSTVGGYMSNYVFDIMNVGSSDPTPFVETGIIDPRAPYYLYRQTDVDPSGSNLPCLGNASYEYCYVGNFYIGRDHTDEAGIPNDGDLRTTWGVYPAGGAYDDGSAVQTENSNNANGEGIQPIYLSSFTHFALAESALTINAGGNARALLEQGIRLSMAKVSGFAGSPTMSSTDINNYVNRVLAEYDSGDKLAVIAREYYLASWGQGIEPYNTYRRTGEPDLQSPILGSAGAFPRSFLYPDVEVSGNPNIQQRALTTRVFWDNNPANGFID